MESVLLKFKNYENLHEFLECLFYKNKELSEPALKFLEKLDREKIMFTKKWKRYIIEIFGCYPLKENERKDLEDIYNEYHLNLEKGRGKKLNLKILEKSEKNEINILPEQKLLLEKSIRWNSSVSGYYSILKKLKKVGLIEKKEGEIKKSKNILKTLNKISEIFMEKEDGSLVYSPK